MLKKRFILFSLMTLFLFSNVNALENSSVTDLQNTETVSDVTTQDYTNIVEKAKIGWQLTNDNKWVYYDENGNMKQNELTIINGEKYYFDENGYRYGGFKKLEDDKIYFFSYSTGKLKKGWQSVDGKNWFYCNDDGSIKYNGLYTIDGVKYYFDENGYRYGGFKKLEDNKIYFFSYSTGKLKRGWQSVDGKNWFYCNDDGSIKYNGLYKIDGVKYYFDENGYRYGGFKKLEDDKIYFFSYSTGRLKKGWQSVDGKNWFYCNDDGSIKYNGLYIIDGIKYYFDENGYRYGGFKKLEDDKVYFFSYSTGRLKKGWQSIDGINKFYCNDDGTVATGFKTINSKVYYFSQSTYYLKKGWQSIDGINKFYCNDDGTVVSGFKKIDNKIYYFGSVNYFLKGKGWQSKDGVNKFYTLEDGSVVTGFKEIDGTLYYFSQSTYYLKRGWQYLETSKIFYCNDDGSVIRNKVNEVIEGRSYSFDENGYLLGFYSDNGRLHYKNPDGSEAKGVQRIAGKYFMFDTQTGAFQSFVNQKMAIDVSSHQGLIDWKAVKDSGLVDAVILRLGYGTSYVDSFFLHNVAELNKYNIPFTIYLFSYAENGYEASLEAWNVINTIRNNNININSSMSIYYDLEDWEIKSTNENSYSISKESYREIINTFISTVESNLGIRTRVYASLNYIYDRFPSDVQSYVTWVAQWNNTGCTYKNGYEVWQYSSSGSIPGISTKVDLDIIYF